MVVMYTILVNKRKVITFVYMCCRRKERNTLELNIHVLIESLQTLLILFLRDTEGSGAINIQVKNSSKFSTVL